MNNKINTKQPISCTFCGYGPVRCRTRETGRTDEVIMVEHQYICPKCNQNVRIIREQIEIKLHE